MALKFKIGDRVRLTRDIARCWQKGDSVTVLGPSHIKGFPYGIKHGKHDGTMCVEESEIEPVPEPAVEPEPKFKIGDQVRTLVNLGSWPVGTIGKIIRRGTAWGYDWRVKWDNVNKWWVNESEIELAPEPTTKPDMGDNIWSLGFPRDTRIPAGVSLRDYWEAPTWSDDLYRLLYDDLVGEIAHLRDELRRAKGE